MIELVESNLKYYKQANFVLEKMSSDLPEDMKNQISQYFKENVSTLLSENINPELVLILDTNAVIEGIIGYIKRGTSTLIDILKIPFLKIYAPTRLKEEMNKHIKKIATSYNYDVDKIREIWELNILSKIKIINDIDDIYYNYGDSLIGERDKKDVEYAALFFQLNAHGIITKDKDLTSNPELRTWRLSETITLTTKIYKGIFSFYIKSKLIPEGLNYTFKIIFDILKTIFNLIVTILNYSYKVFKGIVTDISKLPKWILISLRIITIGVILNEKTRNIIINITIKIKNSLIKYLKSIYEWFKPIIKESSKIIQISIDVSTDLFKVIDDSIDELNVLEVNNSYL